MTTIKLQTALKLIRFNHDDPEVREIIQTAIEELDRLYQVELQFIEFKASLPADPDLANWKAHSTMVRK